MDSKYKSTKLKTKCTLNKAQRWWSGWETLFNTNPRLAVLQRKSSGV